MRISDGIIHALLTICLSAGLAVDAPAARASGGADRATLQYLAGNHVLGFAPGKAILAGLDHALTVEFLGGTGVRPTGEAKGTARGAAPPLGKVTYRGAWSGVDVIFTPEAGGIVESTYVVHPGSEVSDIRLGFNVPAAVDDAGGLRFAFASGVMTEKPPLAWQDDGGSRRPVDVRFLQHGDRVVGLSVGPYDRAAPLVIDPGYSWHTFLGDWRAQYPRALAVDAAGNAYVAGVSSYAWDGPGGTPPLNGPAQGENIVVAKLSPAGVYQWHTFYGCPTANDGYALAADEDGVYLAGYSYSTWNGPGNIAPVNGTAWGADILVLKLSHAGAYQWHTFHGSGTSDYGYAIAVDGDHNVLVAGRSDREWEGPAGALPRHAYTDNADIVALKLSPSGAYLWHTFYGTSGADMAYALAVDAGGNAYVGGTGGGWDGPGGTPPLNAHAGFYDMTLVKLSPGGSYLWHTFHGSDESDVCSAMALDADGSVYLGGTSSKTWDGPGGVRPLNPLAGPWEFVAVKLSPAGAYLWHTFHGSSGEDELSALALDGSGGLYLAGTSPASWNGPGVAAPLVAYAGLRDMAVVKLTTAGAYRWHTFLGSAASDCAVALAARSSADVYVAGYSGASWNGPGGIPPLNPYAGGDDFLVAKLWDALSRSFFSAATLDGWVLESREASGRGGSLGRVSTTLRIGDDGSDRQYRSVLSFDTSTLPDGARVLEARLGVRHAGVAGTSPFLTHQRLLVDIRKGSFSGLAALQAVDFQAAPGRSGTAAIGRTPSSGWYRTSLGAAALPFVNLRGLTQLRLRFARDDNDDRGADYLTLFSGNAGAANRPVLEVGYTVP